MSQQSIASEQLTSDLFCLLLQSEPHKVRFRDVHKIHVVSSKRLAPYIVFRGKTVARLSDDRESIIYGLGLLDVDVLHSVVLPQWERIDRLAPFSSDSGWIFVEYVSHEWLFSLGKFLRANGAVLQRAQ